MICPSGGFVESARQFCLFAQACSAKISCAGRRWMRRIEPVGVNHRAVCAAALVIGPNPSSRGALATKQSSFLCCLTKAGLLRCARNDGRGYRAVWPRLWSRLSEPRFRPVEPGDDNGGCGRRSQLVIPGHRVAMSPESITTTGSMDSGQPPHGFRNDKLNYPSADKNSNAFSRDGKRPSSR